MCICMYYIHTIYDMYAYIYIYTKVIPSPPAAEEVRASFTSRPEVVPEEVRAWSLAWPPETESGKE